MFVHNSKSEMGCERNMCVCCAYPVCDDGGFKLRSMMRSKGNLVVNRAQEGILVGMQKLRE